MLIATAPPPPQGALKPLMAAAGTGGGGGTKHEFVAQNTVCNPGVPSSQHRIFPGGVHPGRQDPAGDGAHGWGRDLYSQLQEYEDGRYRWRKRWLTPRVTKVTGAPGLCVYITPMHRPIFTPPAAFLNTDIRVNSGSVHGDRHQTCTAYCLPPAQATRGPALLANSLVPEE